MMTYKTDMNIIKRLSSTFTKENWAEDNYILVNQAINIYKSNKPQKSPQKRLSKIFNQQVTRSNIYTRNWKISRITK